MSQEVELRFAAEPDALNRLVRGPALGGFVTGRPSRRLMTTVYYDTPDFGFAKAGYSVRVRKSGRLYVQSVKGRSVGALASDRNQQECRLPSSQPNLNFVHEPEMRERLLQIAESGPLAAVMETEINRVTRPLRTPSGDELELALDRGELRTLVNGHAVVPISELELELKTGTPLALYEIARYLTRNTSLTLFLESKSERGMRALEGRDISPQKAGRMELDPGCTAEEAFRATLLHCLRHIARNAASVAEARDPEGIHQIRVGLRRLRAALSAFGGAFRTPPMEALCARAKTLADLLGDTRELDVFAIELLSPIENETRRADLAQLRAVLEELRRESWDRAARLVRSDDFTGFALDLASAAESRLWREQADPEQLNAILRPARDLACETLDEGIKKACRRARHLAALSTAKRHRLRIALKRLRYSAEFFAPLFSPKAVTGFLERMSKLQDMFGTLNDAATAEVILSRVLERAGERRTPELREAAAFVEGWHLSRLGPTWTKAKKRWKRFMKTEAFWRE